MASRLTVVDDNEAEDADGGVDGDGPVERHAEPPVHRQVRVEGRRVHVLQPAEQNSYLCTKILNVFTGRISGGRSTSHF